MAREPGTGRLLGYTWAMRNQYAPWSREEMVAIRIAHVALDIPVRERMFLCAQMLRMWEKFADACEIKIICSTTMREDQRGFLRLHQEAGYTVRGSIGYKRLNLATFEVYEEETGTMNTVNTRMDHYDPDRLERQRQEAQEHSVSSGQFRAAG